MKNPSIFLVLSVLIFVYACPLLGQGPADFHDEFDTHGANGSITKMVLKVNEIKGSQYNEGDVLRTVAQAQCVLAAGAPHVGKFVLDVSIFQVGPYVLWEADKDTVVVPKGTTTLMVEDASYPDGFSGQSQPGYLTHSTLIFIQDVTLNIYNIDMN